MATRSPLSVRRSAWALAFAVAIRTNAAANATGLFGERMGIARADRGGGRKTLRGDRTDGAMERFETGVIPSERSESRNRRCPDREPLGRDDGDSSTAAVRAFARNDGLIRDRFG